MDLSFLHHHLSESNSELKLVESRDNVKPQYVGANLQTSRTPSAIDHHCRRSYQSAKRKLHSSRAKVRFYVTGEGDHNAVYAVSPQRFSSFDSLLGRLTKAPICNKENANKKYIFSLGGSHKITSLEELQSGESYVCATYEVFDQLTQQKDRPMSMQSRFRSLQTAALAAARPTHTSQSTRSRHSIAVDGVQIQEEQSEEQQFIVEIKPRLITVLRGGLRPRKSVRILLNKKITRSFEQIISGISEILCPGEPIKRLFGMSGRLAMCIADFYLEDTVFFAYCKDKMHPEDLTLDKSEVKYVGAYRFRHASAYGRVTLTSHQKGIRDEEPKSMLDSAQRGMSRGGSEERLEDRLEPKAATPHLPALSVKDGTLQMKSFPIEEKQHMQESQHQIEESPHHQEKIHLPQEEIPHHQEKINLPQQESNLVNGLHQEESKLPPQKNEHLPAQSHPQKNNSLQSLHHLQEDTTNQNLLQTKPDNLLQETANQESLLQQETGSQEVLPQLQQETQESHLQQETGNQQNPLQQETANLEEPQQEKTTIQQDHQQQKILSPEGPLQLKAESQQNLPQQETKE